MATSINCSLNLPSPNPSSQALINSAKPTQIPWSTKEDSLKNRWFTGVTCMIIGSAVGFSGGDTSVLASDFHVTIESEGKVARWSDKRSCPQWHANSLENIMPENLPRPFARRKSDAIDFFYQNAPTVGVSFGVHSNCFSL